MSSKYNLYLFLNRLNESIDFISKHILFQILTPRIRMLFEVTVSLLRRNMISITLSSIIMMDC